MDMLNAFRLTRRNLAVNTDPGTLVFLLLMPTMYLVFMGYMYGSLITNISVSSHAINYISFLAPGIISFQALTAGSVAGSMLWSDRRYGMFEQILSGPYTRAEYLMGIIITTMALSIFGALFMLFLSFILRATISLSLMTILSIIVSLVFGSLFWGSLMLALAAKSKSNQMYNSIQILILFFASFASTVFYPLSSAIPLALRYTAIANPLTYLSDSIRFAYVGHFGVSFVLDEAVLLIETIVMFLIALLFYRNVRVGVR
ncbi:MAG: ABC transporter permease [Methanomassiliicoccales archaeon]